MKSYHGIKRVMKIRANAHSVAPSRRAQHRVAHQARIASGNAPRKRRRVSVKAPIANEEINGGISVIGGVASGVGGGGVMKMALIKWRKLGISCRSAK